MKSITFHWDEKKNEGNQKKHGVSFEEAQTVFFDENAILFYDTDHSANEDRFLLLGRCSHLSILIISHSYSESESIIRIISARKATKKEQEYYFRRKK